MRKLLFLSLICLLCALSAQADNIEKTLIYKTVDGIELEMVMISPEKPVKKAASILFFFGGGWNGGTIEQLRPQAEMLVEKGMTAFLVNYRVKGRHKTNPDKAISDAKSAVRYVRENAKSLGLNPNKIAASGASAGGHLAAAAAYIKEFDEPTDNLKISPVPDALVLFNPVVDNSPEGYHTGIVKAVGWEKMSPMHHIKDKSPDALFLVGDKDNFVPVASAKAFKEAVDKTGNHCELVIYPGAAHTFFNWREKGNKYYDLTMQEVMKFLGKLGYIKID